MVGACRCKGMTNVYICLGYGVLHANLDGDSNEGSRAVISQSDMLYSSSNLANKKSWVVRREETLYGGTAQPN